MITSLNKLLINFLFSISNSSTLVRAVPVLSQSMYTFFTYAVLGKNPIYLSIYLSVYLWLYSSLLGLGRFFSFSVLYTVGRIPRTGDQPVAMLIPTRRTTQTQNKRTQTSMPRVGFESTNPLFERAKTVHALDRAATLIGLP
jgi:hypothetical protein